MMIFQEINYWQKGTSFGQPRIGNQQLISDSFGIVGITTCTSQLVNAHAVYMQLLTVKNRKCITPIALPVTVAYGLVID